MGERIFPENLVEKALHFGNVGSKFSSKKKSLVEILVDFFWGEWRRCLEVGVRKKISSKILRELTMTPKGISTSFKDTDLDSTFHV